MVAPLGEYVTSTLTIHFVELSDFLKNLATYKLFLGGNLAQHGKNSLATLRVGRYIPRNIEDYFLCLFLQEKCIHCLIMNVGCINLLVNTY